MISHSNVMANAIQYSTFDSVARKKFGVKNQAVLGLLPFSHIYGLVVMCYSNAYRGDSIIVLPKFELDSFLGAVQDHKIQQLYVVSDCIHIHCLCHTDTTRSPQLQSRSSATRTSAKSTTCPPSASSSRELRLLALKRPRRSTNSTRSGASARPTA